MHNGRFVWIDMEMTGLDAENDRVLEVAVLMTNDDLEILAEGPCLVIHQSDEVLNGMNDWNRTHHGQSGLTERVRASSISESEAEQSIMNFLSANIQANVGLLAGNSVYQDRRFLARYMPRVDAYLHYRLIDVSTIKELAGYWCPEAYSARPPKRATHRALDDILESIEELRYYRNAVFRVNPALPLSTYDHGQNRL